jgi:hypothetical protein
MPEKFIIGEDDVLVTEVFFIVASVFYSVIEKKADNGTGIVGSNRNE